ncbi:hypothetical protein KKF84_22620 [Myxococcota bacterium]|nr:hypothetical protein [Myxococcota bacterium]MBU1538123.1 hypothetical protein [Myxococcota bacterium]
MKIFTLFAIFALVACTPKKQEAAPDTTPTPRGGKTEPTLPNTVKTPSLGDLPTGISKRDLADKTVFSLYNNGLSEYIDSFFLKGIHDADSPVPTTIKMTLSMGASQVKREMKRELIASVKGMRARTFRDFFDTVPINGGILYGGVRGDKTRKFHELAFFKPMDLKGFLQRVSRGEFGVFTSASWGGEISQKGVMNNSRKGSVYLYHKDGYVLLSTDINFLVPGMALSLGSFRAADKASFAFSVSDMSLFWRKIRRPVRHIFGSLRGIVRGYVADLSWFSFVAHKPVGSVYEFTGFKRFISAPKSLLAKAVLKPKTADRLSRFIARDAGAFLLDGMDPALFGYIVDKYNKFFEALKIRKPSSNKQKLIEYMLKQGARAKDIVAAWSGYHASSLRLVKGKFLLSGALSLNDKSKGKEILGKAMGIMKDMLPQNLAKALSPHKAKKMKALKKMVAFGFATKRFGKVSGATVTITVKWSEKLRKAASLSRQEMEMVKMMLGNRIELSIALQNEVILYSLGASGTAREIAAIAKEKGGFPGNYKPKEGLSYSGIYGANMATLVTKIMGDAMALPILKKRTSIVAAMKQAVSYLKKYEKGSWSYGTLGTKKNILIGNLVFGADCIRIPSTLAYIYLGHEASRSRH